MVVLDPPGKKQSFLDFHTIFGISFLILKRKVGTFLVWIVLPLVWIVQVCIDPVKLIQVCVQCSKLTSVRRPMADDSPSGLTFFEKITIASALMADTILDINMKIETVGPVG